MSNVCAKATNFYYVLFSSQRFTNGGSEVKIFSLQKCSLAIKLRVCRLELMTCVQKATENCENIKHATRYTYKVCLSLRRAPYIMQLNKKCASPKADIICGLLREFKIAFIRWDLSTLTTGLFDLQSVSL